MHYRYNVFTEGNLWGQVIARDKLRALLEVVRQCRAQNQLVPPMLSFERVAF